MKCCTCGRAWATTRAPATCTARRTRGRGISVANCRHDVAVLRRSRASAARPPRRSGRSAPANGRRSWMATSGACWRAASWSPARPQSAVEQRLWQLADDVRRSRMWPPIRRRSWIWVRRYAYAAGRCARLSAGVAAVPHAQRTPARDTRAAAATAGRTRAVVMLLAQIRDGSVLLERRAERGVWGGLWCPPQFPSVEAAQLYAATRLRWLSSSRDPLPSCATPSRTSSSRSRRSWRAARPGPA